MPRERLRRNRRTGEMVLLTAIASLTISGFLLTALLGYAVWQLEQIERFQVHDVLTAAQPEPLTASDILELSRSRTQQVANVDQSTEIVLSPSIDNPLESSERTAENYLLVGSDSVRGISADDAIMSGRTASIGNHLADTIMILRLRNDGTAAVVSVPRDLIVPIASTDSVAKINSAYNLDSSAQTRAARLIETVEQHFNIGLQHFVEVDLDGFRRLVDAVGGVSICFNRPTRDRTIEDSGDVTQGGTGFSVAQGWSHLNGDAALAFVRSRRLLTQQDSGEWVRLGVWNDLERNSRQQQFIFQALDQALGGAVGNPRTLQRLLEIVSTHLRTSNTLSVFDDGLELARRFRGLNVDTDLERYAFQLIDMESEGQLGLELLDNEHNERVKQVFQGIGWNAVVEDRVTVSVQGPNALNLAAKLRGIRFDANHENVGAYPSNRIRYGVGGEHAAALLAARLREPIEIIPDPSLVGNQLGLEIGSSPPSVMLGYRAVEAPPAIAQSENAAVPPPPRTLGICG